MSINRTIGAFAATLTTVCGMSAAAALPASGATSQCGASCIEIFSAEFGTPASPNFVETVFHGVAAAGVPTILHRPSGHDPAGDLILPLRGPVPVSQFYAHGMVSAAVNSHYGSEPAVQVEYAPLGVPTGLCAALATSAYQIRTKDSACSPAAFRGRPCGSSMSRTPPPPRRPTSRWSTDRRGTSPTPTR